MDINRLHKSQNFSNVEIDVSHVVIHGTGVDCARTIEIFTGASYQVSAHLVMDRDGAIYELVSCLDGRALRAWHAGDSRWDVSQDGRSARLERFNDFSIGIELVNVNGNVFPYTEAQYKSLFGVINLLRKHYPALNNPESIIGHEQIAGFRGKIDPGRKFDWSRLFSACYPGQMAPERVPKLPEDVVPLLADLYSAAGFSEHPPSAISADSNDLCQRLSLLLERLLK